MLEPNVPSRSRPARNRLMAWAPGLILLLAVLISVYVLD